MLGYIDMKLIFVCKLRVIKVQKLIIFTKNKKVENKNESVHKAQSHLSKWSGLQGILPQTTSLKSQKLILLSWASFDSSCST